MKNAPSIVFKPDYKKLYYLEVERCRKKDHEKYGLKGEITKLKQEIEMLRGLLKKEHERDGRQTS